MKNIQQLENIFSSNVKSPIFSSLADFYFSNRQYDYAHRVCKVGLKNNPNNNEGKYILAKVYLVKNKISKAENLLQEIILKSQYHLSAFLLLIPVMQELNRSNSHIASYVKKVVPFYSGHSLIKNYYQTYCKTTPSKKIYNKNSIDIKSNTAKLSINKQLITKTMYKLFVKQKKYHVAYEILQTMKKNKKNIKFVKQETPKMLNKINDK
tara:strand:+ start:1824 stop:2450 length:627 start_codon:yes stop_codon:yes gene_type:complete